ncbi:uncharacterized protein LOC110457916 [Mizuhopecten yessoensis]|nr:uncharacterized protein LOC110457916 [Mizuhopecten yessoensis]
MDSLVLPPECTERTNRDIFLTNTFNMSFLEDTDLQSSEPFDCSVHGPALTNETLKHDFVNAIRCEQSHNLLDAYLNRRRTWPDSSALERLRTINCVLVTLSHPNSSSPSLEFRISFASVEKNLIRNFSDNQFACYGFLKIVKRRIESDDAELKTELKSYYLKTALLWISEQLEPSIWTDTNFLYCTSICLSYLHHCLRSRNLPQLFQPENNLVDHLQIEDCDRMANALEKYILFPVNARMFMRCWCDDSFDQHFDKLLARPRRNLHEGIADILQKISATKLQIDLISPLVESGTISFYLLGCTVAADSVVSRVLYQMIIRDLDNIVEPDMTACIRSLLYRQLASIIHRQPRFVRNNNILAEEFYKNSLTMVYPISGFDDQQLSGKTNLALFHYLNGEYKDAMTALCDVENILNQADMNRTLLLYFVGEDLPRLWRDPFLTKMIQTLSVEVEALPVKYNALGFYILARCMDELYNKGEICIQRARLEKLKRSVLVNERRLSALEKYHRIYTALILDAAYTVITELIAKLHSMLST